MRRTLTLAAVLLALSTAALAADLATVPLITDRGPASALRGTPTAAPLDLPAAAPLREGDLLWQSHHEDAIYTSCGIAGMDGPVFAGTFLNPPLNVEAQPIANEGDPDWTFAGTEFFVDASRSGAVLAAVDFDSADSTATVYEWRPGSSTPLWSFVIHPCRSMVYEGWASRKPIQVADAGNRIVVAVTSYVGGDQIGRLLAFAPGSGTPTTDYTFPQGNVVATALSADGEYVAMAGWPTLYVYDLAADALRWSGPIGSGNDALAISPTGEYLAWGWTTLQLRRWNGSTYGSHWSHTPGGGTYLGQVAIGPGDLFAVAWDNGNNTVNELAVETRFLADADLFWRYDYEGEPASTHVDIPSSMVFSTDGRHLAVGSWGGSFPELHVFDVEYETPIYTLDTPGSIFDVDIVEGENGGVLVSACGKQVHAGTGGRGGDLYLVEANQITAAEAIPTARPSLSAHPNPFNPRTTLRFTLPAPGAFELSIHDAAGRRVHAHAGSGPAGEQAYVWDAGGLASGVYIARLEAASEVTSMRLILLK